MRCFGMLLDGRARETGIRRRGELATLLIVFNSWHDVVNFKLPAANGGVGWTRVLDTNLPETGEHADFDVAHEYGVTGRSLVVFQLA
jgi:glycogen operon protein